MNKNKISLWKRLEKIRGKIAELEATEKEIADQYRAAEDAEKLEIIRKKGITPEQLRFFNGISEEEIQLILEKRKEGRSAVQRNNEKE